MHAKHEAQVLPAGGFLGARLGQRLMRATPSRVLLPALLVCGLTTWLAGWLLRVFDLANVVILFVFAVVLVALRWGSAAGALSALLGVVSFDFFFVPPVYSFHLSDTQYLFTLVLTLVVAVVTGQLAARLREQTASAQAGERHASALATVAGELSAAHTTVQVGVVCARTVGALFGGEGVLLLPDRAGHIGVGAHGIDREVAQWVHERCRPAAAMDVLAGVPWHCLPLMAAHTSRGVLALRGDRLSTAEIEPRSLLDACAALIGQALDRIHFADLAREAEVRMQGERLRHALLAAVSHDLRTPLTAIRGMAETLDSPRALQADVAAGVIRSIRQQAVALHHLVTNLLDLARMQDRGVHLQRDWHALDEVIEAALSGAMSSLGTRRVEVQVEAGLPLVELDACLFERVLANLLDNAAKYTPPDTRIWISAGQRAGVLQLRVEDDGPGLPREIPCEAWFTPFTRGARESPISGAGLGLALCHTIVEAHGGRIAVVPRASGGACFELRLPQRAAPVVEKEGIA